ncbi:MAG: ABC transporter substrate-binding protein [Clostridiales bacterium]|nr:ABC transporter substrate-binding protein [Clostridiales bacterium]
MHRLKNIILIIVFASILFAAGCGPSLQDNKGENVQPIPEIINEVSIPILKYKTVNPFVSKDQSIYFIDKLIYEGLIDLDEYLRPMPLLAESWEYQNDGYELIFHLKKNVLWHDGNVFSANDVVYTINTLKNNNKYPPSKYKFYVSNIKKIDKIDDYTVKIIFNSNYDNSIERFIFPIFSQKYNASVGNVYEDIAGYTPVGTGPYKIDEIEKLKYIKLCSFENYWGKEKALNSLIFKVVPSSEEAIQLLEIDDIQIAFSYNYDWEKYREDRSLSIYNFPTNELEVLGFNIKNEVLSDRRVRQAISFAINRDDIINTYLGAGIKSDNLYPPYYLNINESKGLYPYSPAKALYLLQEAGFENRDSDRYLEDMNGNELSFNILVNEENKDRIDSAKIINKSLDKIGVSSNIIYVSFDEYESYLEQGKFDLFLGGWSTSPLVDLRFILHSNLNKTGYVNTYLDFLLADLQRNHTIEEKEKIFEEIQNILNEDVPYYCLLYKNYGVIAKNNLVGDIKSRFFDIYNGSESWQIIKPK